MGNVVQYPAVIAARSRLALQWMSETLASAKDAPMAGVLSLD